jgi:hypothetical protein
MGRSAFFASFAFSRAVSMNVRCVEPVVAVVGHSGVAGELVEEPRVDAVGPPVRQAVLAFLANAERNALFAHLAAAAHRMAKLIDHHVLVEGFERLLVSFQCVVALDASALELGANADAKAVTTVRRREIRLDGDECIFPLAHELERVSFLQRFLHEFGGPFLDR